MLATLVLLGALVVSAAFCWCVIRVVAWLQLSELRAWERAQGADIRIDLLDRSVLSDGAVLLQTRVRVPLRWGRVREFERTYALAPHAVGWIADGKRLVLAGSFECHRLDELETIATVQRSLDREIAS